MSKTALKATQTTVRIGVDGNEANVTQRVGSNVYAFELLQALYHWLDKTRQFQVVVYISGARQADMPRETAWWQYREVPRAPLSILWKLPLALRGNPDKLSLWYSPGHYVPSWCPVPVVPTIMDLAQELYPDQFTRKDRLQLQLLTRSSVARALHVCVISDSTQRDVIKHYKRTAKDITVIYPAVPEQVPVSETAIQKTLARLEIDSPYILYVGTLQPRKNIVRLIQAFEQLAERHEDWQLVLAGRIGWKSEEIVRAITESPVRQRIRQTGFVSDADKNALIQGAAALALIGLYEGFGLPPLQSIKLGTIPVVSSTSSLPEVVGEHGVTVNPLDISDIARGFEAAVTASAAQRQKWIKQQQKHAMQFSWEHSAEQLGKLLWQLASNTHSL